MLLPPSDLSDFNNMVTPVEAEAYDILKYRSGARRPSQYMQIMFYLEQVLKVLFPSFSPKSPSSLSHGRPGPPTAPYHSHPRFDISFTSLLLAL